MSDPAALPLSGVPASRPTRPTGVRVGVRAGQRVNRRTSLVLSHEDELLLDALRDSMGPDAGIGETLRMGLRRLAVEKGIDVTKLKQEEAAAA